MTDTPRTDAEKTLLPLTSGEWLSVHFARQLEREITRLRAELAQRTAENAKANAERDEARRKNDAIEAMGYEWRWTKSIDENGEQVGAWVMRDAAEADANNERFRRGDGE